MKTAAKKRKFVTPVEFGEMVMIFADQLATEFGRSKKVLPRWREPFVLIEYDELIQNYTASMNSRIYGHKRGVFHYSVLKVSHPNDDQLFPGRAKPKPVLILIDDEKEWEIEAILAFREKWGFRGQFLFKWKRYPKSENSGEPVEELENAEKLQNVEDLEQAWCTDNI